MRAPGGKFGRKKEEAIAAPLTQRNIEEAAKAAGIGVNTLLRWLKVPEFQAAYGEARRVAFGQAVARLQQGTSAAATTLLKTMIDPTTPASVRVRAAEAIFLQSLGQGHRDRGHRGARDGTGSGGKRTRPAMNCRDLACRIFCGESEGSKHD
jgi:hypothetical protein